MDVYWVTETIPQGGALRSIEKKFPKLCAMGAGVFSPNNEVALKGLGVDIYGYTGIYGDYIGVYRTYIILF